jgi:DNA-binding CsgD family transcriptional regulator
VGVAMFNRELEIAELLYQRKSYSQIAGQLKVSPKTISQVRKKIEDVLSLSKEQLMNIGWA